MTPVFHTSIFENTFLSNIFLPSFLQMVKLLFRSGGYHASPSRAVANYFFKLNPQVGFQCLL